MAVQDKQPFVTKAAQKKAEYDRTIASYKQKQVQIERQRRSYVEHVGRRRW